MVRLACVSLPRIDLQLVAQGRPEWKELPAAVVTEEKPLGLILAVNRAARAAGVRPGMRYASALGICPELRAGVVLAEEREALRRELTELLRTFTPEVESSRLDAALFWLNASGLERLYRSVAAWADAVDGALRARGVVASVAVGFTRFGTYAAAKRRCAVTLFEDEARERAESLEAPVGVLPLDHEVLLRLHQLGIVTVRDFVRFAPGALRRRFGSEVEELQRFARGDDAVPVQPIDAREPLRLGMRLLYPEGSVDALLHHLLDLLRELIALARSRRELVTELVFELVPERWQGQETPIIEEIRTASPTLDESRIGRLVRLRLESLTLAGPTMELAVELRTVPADRSQSDLFDGAPRRDPARALAALAEIRAELGNDAVQVAVLHDAHLPEEQFSWRRVERLSPPRPGSASADRPALVRRILAPPTRLSSLPSELRDPLLAGPYELSGGWWQSPYRREYYYLEDRAGRLLWVYFDEAADVWMVQGLVE